ncbi:type II toxin-antitoxin system RnlB family antitoxin [Candidatus Schmidhempelia bombi]|jgi:hypothetical protein|uniref:Uncharacterized protein n=1 Tax=Candidatus Schmidhempelia bombi str. Bimp TaxID=1387197 RepID=A0AB94IDH9_9GAMM|nr:type II toxin-antitoxin system RnlB family antitoxin [Candidatus Schmidhempelia bombi]TEA27521.1 hypothetical protein O970_03375 [Candidatus Schmidhempelia bombi str. Bimp]
MFDINYSLLNSNNIIVITALNHESPLDNLKDIVARLKECKNVNNSILVIFDLLCCNGNEWNRFISLLFDGTKFIHQSFSVLSNDDIMPNIVNTQKLYFTQHPEIIKSSVMN